MNKLLKLSTDCPEDFIFIKNKLSLFYPFSINQIQRLKQSFPNYPIQEFINLITLQKKAEAKFPFADKWFWTDKNYQQASSLALAQYHGKLFKPYSVVADLCCGIGADLLFLSKNKSRCFAVECDNQVLQMAKYNMNYFHRENIIYQPITGELFADDCEAVYIDPDRRATGKRQTQLDNISPNFETIKKIVEKYHNVVVKLSPLLDYEDELLSDYCFEFVSHQGELKECLLKTGQLMNKKQAVLLPQNIIFTEENSAPSHLTTVQKWLLEPDPAIIRGHLVNDLANELKMSRLDENIALLTSDTEPTEIYGRKYLVTDTFNYNLKSLDQYLVSHQIGILDIKTKGFSETVENFRKKLTFKGKNKAVMFIVRIGNKHQCIICEK
jgi:hypothetical protein